MSGVVGMSRLPVLEFVVTLQGALILCLGIVGLGIRWLTKLLIAMSRSRNEVRMAINIIATVEPSKIYEEFEKVSADLEDLKVIGAIWKKFKSTLIWNLTERRVSSTIDPSLLWDAEVLLASHVNLRWQRSVPNVLTGSGLLGTFFGLVVGIFLAKDGLASGDPGMMQEALGQLLGGAYAAFLTSIVGILSYFIYSALEKKMTRQLSGEVDQFCRELAERIPIATDAYLLNDIVRESREQTAQLKNFSHELAISLGQTMNESLTATLLPTLQQLVESVEGLRKEQRSTNQSAIEQMISQFQSSLSGAVGQEFQAMSATFRDLTGAADSIRNMLLETQAGVRGELEAGLAALRDGMRELTDDLRRSESEVAEARRREFMDLQAMMTSTLQELQSKAAEVVDTFLGAGESLRASVNQASQQLVEKILVSANELVQSAAQARERFEQTGDELQAAVEGLRSGVRELASVVETARQNESESVQAWANLIERMGKTLRAVVDVYEDVRALASELQASNHAMQQLSLKMRSAVDELGETSTILQEVGKGIEHQSATLTQVWEDQRSRFERLDQELAHAIEQIHLAYTKLSSEQQQFLASMEQSVERIISHLAAAVNEISEVMEGLEQQWSAR